MEQTLLEVFAEEEESRHDALLRYLEVIDKGILDVKRAAAEVRAMTADLVRRMDALERVLAGDRPAGADRAKE